MKLEEFILPKFAFIDGHSHLGNSLEGRDLIIHFPSLTVIEALAMDDLFMANIEVLNKNYEYVNFAGIVENHRLAVHKSTFPNAKQKAILDLAWDWYSSYLNWEDDNIKNEGNERLN